MMNKKVAVIGVGGRTGTMFVSELGGFGDVLGVAREKEINLIKEKKLYIKRGEDLSKLFGLRVIKDTDFHKEPYPDIIFLAVKNPIHEAIKYYFRKSHKIPALLISQNGISALSDAKKSLEEIFGEASEKVRLIRVVLFNPIDLKKSGDEIFIRYSLPIKIALAPASAENKIDDIVEIFKESGFEVEKFSQKDAKNLEFSKLFLNLIGMASASRSFSIKDGFSDKEIFKEEVMAIKEYIKSVKLSGGNFLNFRHYPVWSFSFLFSFLPFFILIPFRNILANIITKGRSGKPKDLDEIDYYNGVVVELGKKTGVKTPVNEKIYKRGLEKLR
jgi:ketopantoate reductase